MKATTTIPAREVRDGDVVVVDNRLLPIAHNQVSGDLCLLTDCDGRGRLAHAGTELQVACADVAPFKSEGKDRSDA